MTRAARRKVKFALANGTAEIWSLTLGSTIILACILSLSASTPAGADTPTLTSETASGKSAAVSHADEENKVLDGSVKETVSTDAPQNPPASDSASQPNSQASNQGQGEQAHMYNLAVSKLVARGKMTSEDFRNLQMGMTGFALTREYNQKYAEVSQVFPGCPAEQAGVKVGDVVVEGDVSQNYRPSDPTQPIWAYTGGKAGSVVNIKVLRNGELIPISITRMNIEDVPDAKIRKFYENMAQKFAESEKVMVRVDKPSDSILNSGK